MDKMSQAFFKVLSHYEEEDYLYFYLRYHLAPVIQYLKPASTLTITSHLQEKWDRYGIKILKRLGLQWKILKDKREHSILLIYRQELIENLLRDKAIKEYLRGIGYPVENLEDVLGFLAKRYNLLSYPHEIGIILGIPLEDVKIFTDNPKRPCAFKGYWKVYTQPEKAKVLFKAYDEVRFNMIKAPI